MSMTLAIDRPGEALAPFRPRRASTLRRMRVRLAWTMRTERKRRRRSATIKELSQLDDHILKDIGLSRDDFIGRW